MCGVLLLAFTLRSLAMDTPLPNLPNSGRVELLGTVERVIGPKEFILRQGSGTVYVYKSGMIHTFPSTGEIVRPILKGVTVRVTGTVQYRIFGHSLFGNEDIVDYPLLNRFLMKLRSKHIRAETVEIMN
jgi:hypothetical protein